MNIPFNKPFATGSERRYIVDALKRNHLSGDGYYTERCSRFLETTLQAPRVLLTPSCTHALELASLLLKISPKDEIILPSYTFPSTANAFAVHGAIPRFVDIRPDTLNMDERLVEARITRKTRAIVAVHYAGVPCQMDVLSRLAKKHGIPLVEDAAQALGASFQGRPAGTWGALGAFSFHETKNCQCGEGGALVINNRSWITRGEMVRQMGTNRSQFYRGEVDKYSWVDIGSSYVPSELQTAYLWAQLQKLSQITARRKQVYDVYRAGFAELQTQGKARLPVIPADCQSAYHNFFLLFDTEKIRDRVIQRLGRANISATFHYFPLHLSKMGRSFGAQRGECPVTEKLSGTLVRLPMYNAITPAEQASVIRAVYRAV